MALQSCSTEENSGKGGIVHINLGTAATVANGFLLKIDTPFLVDCRNLNQLNFCGSVADIRVQIMWWS